MHCPPHPFAQQQQDKGGEQGVCQCGGAVCCSSSNEEPSEMDPPPDQATPFDRIPWEMTHKILSFLSAKDLGRSECVCPAWLALISADRDLQQRKQAGTQHDPPSFPPLPALTEDTSSPIMQGSGLVRGVST